MDFIELQKNKYYDSYSDGWRADNWYPLDKTKRLANTNIKGMTILVVGEAGLGDQISNMRFIETIRNHGATTLTLFDDKLSQIVNEAYPFSIQYTNQDYDHYVLISDIPFLFNLTSPSEGFIIPYLKSDKYILPEGLNIGIRWESRGKDHRAIPLQMFAPFSKLGNLYNLQRDTGLEDIQPEYNINTNYSLDSFEDTMKLINSLDVVVTSCCSVAHLSAASGKQTVVLSYKEPYVTWIYDWYPNVSLFCQNKPSNWEHPIISAYKYLNK